jgi:serpin B
MTSTARLLIAGAALPAAAAGADFDAARSANQVGLELYRHLAAAGPATNLVLSPYSIESALALVYAGAEGKTRTEMARALHFPADDAPLAAAFGRLRTALDHIAQQSREFAEARRRDGGQADAIEWHAANRLFGQPDYAFRQAFLGLMSEGHAAPFEPLDFRRSPQKARDTINTWVEEQTRRRIRDLVPRGALTEDTRLVLVNALYLKAPWQKPFEKAATRPRPFTVPGSPPRDVPTMYQTINTGYLRDKGLTIVTLDYLGGTLQFVIALPDEGLPVDAAAANITADDLSRWANLRRERRTAAVDLYLPRFRIEGTTLPLGRTLRQLGVRQAFDEPPGSANFDRMAPRKPNDYLALDDVFHQTFVALDEEGTEAAAATAASMVAVTSAMPPPRTIEVRVDRPFLFALQHRESGVCLFFGRITDPR